MKRSIVWGAAVVVVGGAAGAVLFDTLGRRGGDDAAIGVSVPAPAQPETPAVGAEAGKTAEPEDRRGAGRAPPAAVPAGRPCAGGQPDGRPPSDISPRSVQSARRGQARSLRPRGGRRRGAALQWGSPDVAQSGACAWAGPPPPRVAAVPAATRASARDPVRDPWNASRRSCRRPCAPCREAAGAGPRPPSCSTRARGGEQPAARRQAPAPARPLAAQEPVGGEQPAARRQTPAPVPVPARMAHLGPSAFQGLWHDPAL